MVYGRRIDDNDIAPPRNPVIEESGFGPQTATTPPQYYQRRYSLIDFTCGGCGRKWILRPDFFTNNFNPLCPFCVGDAYAQSTR